MGIYGVIRWMIPNAPLGFLIGKHVYYAGCYWYCYASIIAFKQNDGKRLVAYSSIAHVGLIAPYICVDNRRFTGRHDTDAESRY